MANRYEKRAGATVWYYWVFSDLEDGTNTSGDNSLSQGATISSYSLPAVSGITIDSDNKSSVTIAAVVYPINTVVSALISGGTADTSYTFTCTATMSDSRVLPFDLTIEVIA